MPATRERSPPATCGPSRARRSRPRSRGSRSRASTSSPTGSSAAGISAPEVYSSREERAAEVAAITRAEIEALIAEGVRYIRVAIFASKSDHRLLDLLWRHRRGELPIAVSMVISNHLDTPAEVRNVFA